MSTTDYSNFTNQGRFLTWQQIKTYLLSDVAENIHKLIWDDFAVLTGSDGTRYRIDATVPKAEIYTLVYELKYTPDSAKRLHSHLILKH